VGLGENFEEALARELLEETGLHVDVLKLAGASQFDMRDVCVVTLFMEVVVAGGAPVISDEHEEFRWVMPSDLPALDLASNSRDFMLAYARGARPA
jgi:ADP-ribose pyrophosphatase YjhB (NUDIX family)